MKQLIWPDNILNRTAKLLVMFLFTFIWLLDLIWYSLDLGYVVLKDFVPIYSLLIMYCFLFNRNLPIGGVHTTLKMVKVMYSAFGCWFS